MMIALAVITLLPSLALLVYIYRKDRVEKEPRKLLVGLFFAGVGATVLAIILELILQGFLIEAFFGETVGDELVFDTYGSMVAYQFIENFFCVALVEEISKWLFVFRFTRKSKNFNCLFDGMVYAAVVALGFSAAEDLLYVLGEGLGTALARIVTAVPGHFFFGIIMGYFYSKWRVTYQAADLERKLAANHVIPASQTPFSSGGLLAMSIVVPALVHGTYDFIASTMGYLPDAGGYVLLGVFILFLAASYFFCFKIVRNFAKQDTEINFISMNMVLKKYPDAESFVRMMPEYACYHMTVDAQAAAAEQPVPPQQGYPQYSQPVQNQGYPVYGQPVQQGYPPYGQPMQQQSYPVYGQPVQQQGYPVYGQPVRQQGYPPYGQLMQQQGYPPYGQPVQQQGYPPYGQPMQPPREEAPTPPKES